VTIIVQRCVRPGQDTARVAAELRRVEEHSLPRQGRRPGRVFRWLDDAQVLWSVAEWDSCEAYEARPRAARASALDALCVGAAVRYYFAQIWLSWNMSLRAMLWDGTLVHAPPGADLTVRPFLQHQAGQTRGTGAGLVECRLYQDVHRAEQFLTLRGWASPAAWQHFERERGPALNAALRRLGAIATPVVELTLLEYDRLVLAGP
jgi:hypothetical protein